ncbi:MAG TPA: hypothetical protein DEP66_00255 [Acidimicrobiaceae bacterium]|nr:hypothetical protein [Acidimicrobiaceae bacterium]HCB36678.1 hypothetical protein [Acidimicrobiaceae bacterium]
MDPRVEKALTADVDQRGRLLLAIDENQWYEYKGSRVDQKVVARALVAFANAEGGVLVIGLDDTDGVEGIDGVSADNQTDWRSAASLRVVPPIRVETDEVECVNADGKPDRLLVIRVPASEHVHNASDGEVYVRSGGQNLRLDFEQRRALVEERSGFLFEETPAAGDLSELIDPELVRGYAAAAGFSGAPAVEPGTDGPAGTSQLEISVTGETAGGAADVRRTLSTRRLLTSDGRATTAAVLLFGRDPQAALPHARIRVTKYRGVVRGTGAGQQLDRDEQFEGPLPRQIEAASKMVDEVLPRRTALGDDGLFGPVPIVPSEAWREGIVNAVVHRAYGMAGAYVRVSVFDDRIMIENPGPFLAKWSGADPRELMPRPRNPKIARVCAELSIGEDLGEGVSRIFSAMSQAGLWAPYYEWPQDWTRLTLWGWSGDVAAERGLKPHARRLLTLLRAEESLSTGDLVKLGEMSRTTTLSHLGDLRDAGLVVWEGKSPRDPRAYWRVSGPNGRKRL